MRCSSGNRRLRSKTAHQEHSQQCEDEAKEDDYDPSSSLHAQAGIRLGLGANNGTGHLVTCTAFVAAFLAG